MGWDKTYNMSLNPHLKSFSIFYRIIYRYGYMNVGEYVMKQTIIRP